MKVTYSDTFYKDMEDSNLASARVVAPIALGLVGASSVVDVGCGRGLWLKAFMELGVTDVFGVDGEWVKPDDLVIPKEKFESRDFGSLFTVGKTADLAISLEVAEHIKESAADSFVTALVETAPVIMFSAAIPFQGGTHHVNEQWPEYWAAKFKTHGFVPVDAIRRHVWGRRDVSFFYAQNILMFVKESEIAKYPKLATEIEHGYGNAHSLVHPTLHNAVAADSERWKLVVPYINKLPLGFLRKIKKMMISVRRR